MNKNYVVFSADHAAELFPEEGRHNLRAACAEMVGLSDGPIIVLLTPGKYELRPIHNQGQLQLNRTKEHAPIRMLNRTSDTQVKRTPYEQQIHQAFRDICAKSKKPEASAVEVTELLVARNQLGNGDTVIDVFYILTYLRDRGLL